MQKFYRSLKHAMNGLRQAFAGERNMRIHLVLAVAVIVAGIIAGISKYDWLAIIFAIGFVFTTELINTSLEWICDKVTQDRDPMIRTAKDISAAGVVVSAITAAMVGIAVFLF